MPPVTRSASKAMRAAPYPPPAPAPAAPTPAPTSPQDQLQLVRTVLLLDLRMLTEHGPRPSVMRTIALHLPSFFDLLNANPILLPRAQCRRATAATNALAAVLTLELNAERSMDGIVASYAERGLPVSATEIAAATEGMVYTVGAYALCIVVGGLSHADADLVGGSELYLPNVADATEVLITFSAVNEDRDSRIANLNADYANMLRRMLNSIGARNAREALFAVPPVNCGCACAA